MKIIENALPLDIAENARGAFVDTDYRQVTQIRESKYSDPFKVDSEYLPNMPERYTARFWRSDGLSASREMESLYDHYIRPILGTEEKARLLAYKMTEGDHFRAHVDDNFASLGFVYYLSKGWKWDWGGLLVGINGDSAIPTLPKFNQLAILNHAESIPHFVTEIAACAKEPRYMLVGLI